MREPNPNPRGLSDSAGELLDSWLQSRQPSPELSPPSVDTLVRYQSGVLGIDDIRAVEAALIRFPSGRALLKCTRLELQKLRAAPWSELALLARDDSMAGEVARSWMAVTAKAVESAGTAKETWELQGWGAIRRHAAAGVESARAAWAGLINMAEQLRYLIQAAPPAAARSGSDSHPQVEGELPSGIVGALHAEIDSSGTLNAILSIQDVNGDSSSVLDETVVHLSLVFNDQSWPLEPASITGDRAVWALQGAGTAMGIASGPLPASFFSIAIGAEGERSAAAPKRLMAEILDAEGAAADRVPVPLEIRDGPKWEAGVFRAVILIGGPVRRAYAEYRLRLDVTVGGTARQCLGYWPMSDWTEHPREVTAECPGSPNSAAPYTAILHATIEPK